MLRETTHTFPPCYVRPPAGTDLVCWKNKAYSQRLRNRAHYEYSLNSNGQATCETGGKRGHRGLRAQRSSECLLLYSGRICLDGEDNPPCGSKRLAHRVHVAAGVYVGG